jgi:hypothetical protein
MTNNLYTSLYWLEKILSETFCAERRGREDNTHASYSGGPWLKYRPGDRLSRELFRYFPPSIQANAGIVP